MSGPGAVGPSPTVSLCIPARNAAAFLVETLESVLAQTRAPDEILVCDNASTDETPAICRRYEKAGVHHHRFEELVGQAGNWNRCVDLAQGKYLILLHADDLLAPSFIERAVAMLEHHGTAVLLHCGVELIDANGQPLGLRQLYAEDRADSGSEFFRRLLIEGCLVNPAGVMLRTDAVRHAGPFTTRIRWGIDWHMWMRLALLGDAPYLHGPLAKYRLHAASGTSDVLASGQLAADERWAVHDVISQSRLTVDEEKRLILRARRGIAHRTWCHAEEACRQGRRRASTRGLLEAARVDPKLIVDPRFWGLAVGVAFGHAAYAGLRRILGRKAPA
jgi:glycosyltransferase involved in cell wall biosynthesis